MSDVKSKTTVIVSNNRNRDSVVVDKSSTIRSVLDSLQYKYSNYDVTIDGRFLAVSDLDKQLSCFDVSDKCWLILAPKRSVIYTHDEAALIVELFEAVLENHNISIPSPEDDDRDPDDMVGLYGSTYSDLLDSVEENICDIIDRRKPDTEIVTGVFSGTM